MRFADRRDGASGIETGGESRNSSCKSVPLTMCSSTVLPARHHCHGRPGFDAVRQDYVQGLVVERTHTNARNVPEQARRMRKPQSHPRGPPSREAHASESSATRRTDHGRHRRPRTAWILAELLTEHGAKPDACAWASVAQICAPGRLGSLHMSDGAREAFQSTGSAASDAP